MPPKACAVCGSGLNVNTKNRTARCTNANCPAGGLFKYCGFCSTHSFVVTETGKYGYACANPKCRTYNTKRLKCPTCSNDSLAVMDGVRLCLWRKCKSNKETVRNCFFCKNYSFLNFPDLKVCTKSDCSKLLVPFLHCDFCLEYTVGRATRHCENPACEMFGVKVALCDSCGQRTFVADANSEYSMTCRGKACISKASEFGQTFIGGGTDKLKPVPGGPGDATVCGDATIVEPVRAGHSRSASIVHFPENGAGDGPDSGLGAAKTLPVTVGPEEKTMPGETVDEKFERLIRVRGDDDITLPPPDPIAAAEMTRIAPSEANKTFLPAGDGADSALTPDEDGLGPLAAMEPPAPEPEEPVVFTQDSVNNAYNFINRYVLKRQEHPFLLIIGLAGTGKTTYLTMLGEILANRASRYYFPYRGIDLKRFVLGDYMDANIPQPVIEDLNRRVLDLVYDYSIDSFSRTISKGRWPEPTIPEGAHEKISTKFLVSEITRDRKTIAKLVTVETSGEDYKSIIAGIKNYDRLTEKQRPIQQVLVKMLDEAEGFVVLMDPGDEEKDDTYHDLFLTIHENLQKRAHILFKERLEEEVARIRRMSGEGKRGELLGVFEDIFKERLKSEQGIKRIAAIRQELEVKIQEVGKGLQAQDETVLIHDDGLFLGKLEEVVKMTNPETFERTQKKIREIREKNEMDKDIVFNYYRKLCAFAIEYIGDIASNWFIMEESSDINKDRMYDKVLEEKAKQRLYRACRLDDDFLINTEAFTDRFCNIRNFKNLKHISIVTTKCDMYPIIYPPEDFPRFQLQKCERYIKDIRNFLRILGGDLAVYHSSATGYSVLRDIGRYPGLGSTLTPINIVEPLFTMLNIEKDNE
ncbi:MAG: hypothetical protein ABIF71_05725 [Planctomycetota bacterium]